MRSNNKKILLTTLFSSSILVAGNLIKGYKKKKAQKSKKKPMHKRRRIIIALDIPEYQKDLLLSEIEKILFNKGFDTFYFYKAINKSRFLPISVYMNAAKDKNKASWLYTKLSGINKKTAQKYMDNIFNNPKFNQLRKDVAHFNFRRVYNDLEIIRINSFK